MKPAPPVPVMAKADVKPDKPVEVAARPVAAVKVADARPAEIGGVPAHSLPAIPYRHEERSAPPADRVMDARDREFQAQDRRERTEGHVPMWDRITDETAGPVIEPFDFSPVQVPERRKR